MTNEILLKMNLLGGMDSYVREVIGDDEVTEIWNMYGVPDECDEETLQWIAENDKEFTRICKLMGRLVNGDVTYGED